MAIGGPVTMIERIERGIALAVEHLAELAAVTDSDHNLLKLQETTPC
jgi:hypothetical protein